MNKTILANFGLSLLTLVILAGISEWAFRYLLFGESEAFSRYRDPSLYASWFSDDDYWKLEHRLRKKYRPPKHPDPLLGWVGSFSRKDYIHENVKEIGNRRPVLLYGDSFAQCVGDVTCFQDILNSDEEFTGQHYFLNYGVGGYGVDQIYLLFKNSIDHFAKPFVIFSLLTVDLDRSILSVRTGQKPYFLLEDGALRLAGVPINPNPEEYFSLNPPDITSYLYRLLAYNTHLPRGLSRFLTGEEGKTRRKTAINEKIILEAERELKARHIDHVFLIFHPPTSLKGVDWREPFLKRLFEENDISYISSIDLIKKDITKTGLPPEEYFQAGNNHPTSRYNSLVAQAMKKYVLTRSP